MREPTDIVRITENPTEIYDGQETNVELSMILSNGKV